MALRALDPGDGLRDRRLVGGLVLHQGGKQALLPIELVLLGPQAWRHGLEDGLDVTRLLLREGDLGANAIGEPPLVPVVVGLGGAACGQQEPGHERQDRC